MSCDIVKETPDYRIILHKSGFYSVWIGDNWIDASQKNLVDAVRLAESFVSKNGRKKHE